MINFSMSADLTASSRGTLPIIQQDIQLRANQQVNSNSNSSGGLFLIFFLIGYILYCAWL